MVCRWPGLFLGRVSRVGEGERDHLHRGLVVESGALPQKTAILQSGMEARSSAEEEGRSWC